MRLPRSRPIAVMLTLNIRCTSRTISKNSNSPASPILKGTPAIGFTAPPTGARTTISFTMCKPGSSLATVFNRTTHQRQTVTYTSVTYEPLADSIFELPPAVKTPLK